MSNSLSPFLDTKCIDFIIRNLIEKKVVLNDEILNSCSCHIRVFVL